MIESEWFVVVEVERLEEEEEGEKIICPAILELWYHVKVSTVVFFTYVNQCYRDNI